MELFKRISQGYIDKYETYYIYFELFGYNVYYEVFWNDETNCCEHIINVYKDKKHQFGVSGDKVFMKEKFLNWIDKII